MEGSGGAARQSKHANARPSPTSNDSERFPDKRSLLRVGCHRAGCQMAAGGSLGYPPICSKNRAQRVKTTGLVWPPTHGVVARHPLRGTAAEELSGSAPLVQVVDHTTST